RLLPMILDLCPKRDNPEFQVLNRLNGNVVEIGYTGLHNTKLYPLMHRDIRWPNIILHNEIYILIDFEFAEFAPQEALNQLKENEHAHEVLRGRHDEKVDLWNIGHLIFSSNTHNIPTDLSNLASKLYKDDSSR
ncbi:16296_t:CDS:2, partial [Entrophospora sp. SA101]